MPSMTLMVAGPLHARTGGSIYNQRMAAALAHQGWIVDRLELDDSFPFPTNQALQHASELMASIPSGRLVLIDGLAFGAMPDVIERRGGGLRLVALVHLPLAAAVGLEPGIATRLAESERRALSYASAVIVTGHTTPLLMAEWGLAHHDVTVVEPGVDGAPIARGSRGPTVQLLTVGAVTPGKGHALLIDALATLPTRQWHLTCAGSVTRDPQTVEHVRATISRHGLGTHVSLGGELSEPDLNERYDNSDALVSASLRETYGMAVAEALARGLPVVATATGASPALVGDQAGVVVPPGDRSALAEALSQIVGDAAFRAKCAAGARRVRAHLRDWDTAARELASVLSRLKPANG